MRTLDELLGPLDPIWDDSEPRSKRLTDRRGDEIFFIAHHSVSRTLAAIEATFKSKDRTVTATSGVGPLTAGVDDYRAKQYVPWNDRRPYTTSSWADDQAITCEMANLVLAAPWPVGSTGKSWLAQVIAAMHVELGMPLDRWHVTCHREIAARPGWGSYVTQCPGDDLHGYLDEAIVDAQEIVDGVVPEMELVGGDTMNMIHKKKADGSFIYALFGGGAFVPFTSDQDIANGFSVQAGGPSVLVSEGFWTHIEGKMVEARGGTGGSVQVTVDYDKLAAALTTALLAALPAGAPAPAINYELLADAVNDDVADRMLD
jgi:hypothetical protein